MKTPSTILATVWWLM